MTLTDLQTLASTDEGREKIQTLVAEILEWQGVFRSKHGDLWGIPPGGKHLAPLRHWTSSLDAMAEVEAGLTHRQRYRYRRILIDVIAVCCCLTEAAAEGERVHASALHRAIAFILTKQATKGAE